MTDRDTSATGTPEAPPRLERNECGAFPIRIDVDGRWYYQNSPIGRMPLVKLFATVLSRDADGAYWLTTPIERGTIEVEDVPFVAVEMTVSGSGEDQIIRLRTNLDEWVEVGAEHPLWVEDRKGVAGDGAEHDAAGGPVPYVQVKDGLNARVARSVYYDLVALAVEGKSETQQLPEKGTIGVWSKGQFFPLGSFSDET